MLFRIPKGCRTGMEFTRIRTLRQLPEPGSPNPGQETGQVMHLGDVWYGERLHSLPKRLPKWGRKHNDYMRFSYFGNYSNSLVRKRWVQLLEERVLTRPRKLPGYYGTGRTQRLRSKKINRLTKVPYYIHRSNLKRRAKKSWTN